MPWRPDDMPEVPAARDTEPPGQHGPGGGGVSAKPGVEWMWAYVGVASANDVVHGGLIDYKRICTRNHL
jgi:hypothetical protein